MRVALFGAGRIGPLHARSLLVSDSVEGVIVFDVVSERARVAAAEFGAIAAATPDAALDVADAVVITASTDDHPSLIRRALDRGLPTFCEKPLAADLADAIAVMHDVEASSAPFQLGFQRRFDPAYVEARRLIEAGALGHLHMVSLRSHDPQPASEAFIASSDGMFRDLAIHDVDVLRFLTAREVAEIFVLGTAHTFPVCGKYEDHATAVGVAQLADGTPVAMSWARHDSLGHDVRTEIFESEDSISVGLGPRMPMRSVEPGVPPPAGPAWSIFLDRWDVAYRDEMTAFLEVARGERTSPCTGRDGVEAQRIAEALSISAAEHRVVTLREIPS